MITLEVLEKNKNKFLTSVKTYEICNDSLLEFLEEKGFFEAPASTLLTLHNAFPGGLVDHLLRVTTYAVKINELLPSNLKNDKKSVIKVCLLHSIGKSDLYLLNKNDWQIKNQGKMYEFNNELIPLTVGERSLYYIHNTGNNLSELEYQAILNYEKDSSDKMAEWHTSPLGEILKMAIKLAIIEEKENQKS